MLGHIRAVSEKLQSMHPRQISNELLIGIRLLPAQLVIEMDYGQNNSQITAHFEQQPQQGNRIDPPGNSDANAVPGFQQLMPPNVGQHALRERVHRNMVQLPELKGQPSLALPWRP